MPFRSDREVSEIASLPGDATRRGGIIVDTSYRVHLAETTLDLRYSPFRACKRRDSYGTACTQWQAGQFDTRLPNDRRGLSEKKEALNADSADRLIDASSPCQDCLFLSFHILDFLLRAAALYADPFELNVYCLPDARLCPPRHSPRAGSSLARARAYT